MSKLPAHGRIDCSACFKGQPVQFDRTRRTQGHWRITANPIAWGNPEAEVVVLGFSKGPTQAGALDSTPHDEIAFKGGRAAVGRILHHVGLLPLPDGANNEVINQRVSALIACRTGRFHFGSLVKCTVEQYHQEKGWIGTGAGMLDRFVASDLGRDVASCCTLKYLANLPTKTRLVLMFGTGTQFNYVEECFRLIQSARPGKWSRVGKVAYTDGKVMFVHVEHFKSQGALIPQWLGAKVGHPRAELGRQAQEAVKLALS